MNKQRLQDVPSGGDGKAYFNLNGSRLDAFRIAKITGKLEPIVEEKKFLGDRMQQHAVRGLKGTGDMSYYQVTAEFIKAWRDYKNGGDVPDIELQYYSDPETSNSERVEVVMTGAIPANIPFGALDDSSNDAQKLDTSYTFDDFDVL
ncbi:phage tail tube protein [Clostridium sp. KNHs216]|uniref:phage tail tube protein n=1 Tax=Clostridium sp. KNHs216 TaxID=1550235 RepID=UPI0011522BDD|nr:phage tail tube protein [Clostridium sp. KNHs216]TQI69005.1 tail tube protein [Clostridium sp. KNHs216]